MGFSDDYPLNPPPLPDDWSKPEDRNQYDSLQEVRANMRIFAELVDGLHREEITLPDGRVVTALIRESGRNDLFGYGFQVTRKNETSLLVAPSVVTGMGASGSVPVISGTPLDEADPPTVSLSVGQERWICLWMEIEPSVEEVFISSMPPFYRILEGGGLLVGEIEVRLFENAGAMEAASRLPAVNGQTGDVTQTGFYVIPLAKHYSDGTISQLGYQGPIGVRMCASGAVVALGPARGTMTEA